MKTVAVIGAGRLGTSLGAALARKKGYDVTAVADRDPDAAKESLRIIGRGRIHSDNAGAAAAADLVFLCLPDDGLDKAVRKLSSSDVSFKGKIIFHMSGLLPSRILSSLKKRGAAVASFHPMQSFPGKRTPASHFKGISFGFEGDRKALAAAEEIAETLGGRILRITAQNKPLYHAACVMASNYIVVLLDQAQKLLMETDAGKEKSTLTLLPLVEGILHHVKKVDVQKALTGPIIRGDIDTVRRHLRALLRHPGALEVYRILGKQALLIAAGQGLPAERVTALRRLLEGK